MMIMKIKKIKKREYLGYIYMFTKKNNNKKESSIATVTLHIQFTSKFL
jgi:hypothetical protein